MVNKAMSSASAGQMDPLATTPYVTSYTYKKVISDTVKRMAPSHAKRRAATDGRSAETPADSTMRPRSAAYYRNMRSTGDGRVVISGIGVVSPFGVGRERFWTHVSRGCSATRAITDFDASPFTCTAAAPV